MADEYIVAFEELEHETKYNIVTLVNFFERGLNDALIDKLYGLENMPKSL